MTTSPDNVLGAQRAFIHQHRIYRLCHTTDLSIPSLRLTGCADRRDLFRHGTQLNRRGHQGSAGGKPLRAVVVHWRCGRRFTKTSPMPIPNYRRRAPGSTRLSNAAWINAQSDDDTLESRRAIRTANVHAVTTAIEVIDPHVHCRWGYIGV